MTAPEMSMPICECAAFWESHHPDCPVRRRIESLQRENEAFKEIARSDQDTIESLERENGELRANLKAEQRRLILDTAVEIESLQQENKELRTDRDNWKGWKQKASQAAERLEQENAELRAKQMAGPAITPEMREKIGRALEIGPGNDPKFSERVFRDLLGEQG